jgi:hypothetical protein
MDLTCIYVAIHSSYENTNKFFFTQEKACEYINSRPCDTNPIEWRIVQLYEGIQFEADMCMTHSTKIPNNKSTQTEEKDQKYISLSELQNNDDIMKDIQVIVQNSIKDFDINGDMTRLKC